MKDISLSIEIDKACLSHAGPRRHVIVRVPIESELDFPDNYEVALARTIFTKKLRRDQKIKNLFAYWGMQSGLYEAADEVAAVLDRGAKMCGMGHWSQIMDDGFEVHAGLASSDLAISQTVPEGILSALNVTRTPFEKLHHRMTARSWTNDARQFLEDAYSIPWPWLSLYVWVSFLAELLAHRAWGLQLKIQQVAIKPDYEIAIDFRASPGKSFQEEVRKLKRLEEEARQDYKKKHGRRQRNFQLIERYVGLYFRYKVRKYSCRTLARIEHRRKKHPRAFDSCDCRRPVDYALSEAEKLLNASTSADFQR